MELKSKEELTINYFALFMKQMRKSRNMTQMEMAKLLNISQPSIYKIESGNFKQLPINLLNRLNELGYTPQDYLRV